MTDPAAGVGRRVALELSLVVGYALAATLLLVTESVGGPVRIAVAAPLVGFLPGYALLSALFPGTDGGEGGSLTTPRLQAAGLAWFERCSLSVPASLGLLPILAIALSGLGFPLTGAVVAVTLLAVVVAFAAVGLARRLRLADRPSYAPPFGRWAREVRAKGIEADGVDATLNVALALAVLLAMGGLGYGLVAPDRGETFTETALLTQGEDELVAGGYPTAVAQDEAVPLTLSVENREGRPIDYTAVVAVERVRTDGEGVEVLEREVLERRSLAVPDGATRTAALDPAPGIVGDRLRLTVYVYRGEAPESPGPGTADDRLFLWIDVDADGGAPASLTAVGP